MERPLCAHTYVEQPFDEMALLLIQDPRSILQAATDSAAAEACELRSALRVEVGPFEIGRDITVELGEFRPSSMLRVSITIRWHATESAGLFPRMSGTLELQRCRSTGP